MTSARVSIGQGDTITPYRVCRDVRTAYRAREAANMGLTGGRVSRVIGVVGVIVPTCQDIVSFSVAHSHIQECIMCLKVSHVSHKVSQLSQKKVLPGL